MDQLIDWLSQHGKELTVTTVLGAAVIAFIRGWIVAGWVYAEKAKQCEVFQQIALASVQSQSRTVQVAERAVERLKEAT